MKTFCTLFLCLVASTFARAATITSAGDGDWDDTGTWDCGCIPGDGDIVIVRDVDQVDINPTVAQTSDAIDLRVFGAIFIANGQEIRLGCGSTLSVFTGGSIIGNNNGTKIRICGAKVWEASKGDPNPFNGPAVICEDGNGDADCGPLPIELYFFDVRKDESCIRLDWATSSEEVFSHFEIERSADAHHYSRIGSVDGRGGIDVLTRYSMVDRNPILGLSRYRLKAVDIDGSFEYFGPVAIEFFGDQKLKIYPNPVDQGFFHLELNYPHVEDLKIVVSDMTGRDVFVSVLDASTQRVNLPKNFSSGVYLVSIDSKPRKLQQRIVVK